MDFSTLLDLDILILKIPEPTPKTKGEKKAKEAHERAVKARKMLAALQGPHQELKKGVKRKVSDVVAAPRSEKKAAAEALLNMVIEQRGNLSEMHNASEISLVKPVQVWRAPRRGNFLNSFDMFSTRSANSSPVMLRLIATKNEVLRNIQGLISQQSKDEEKACE